MILMTFLSCFAGQGFHRVGVISKTFLRTSLLLCLANILLCAQEDATTASLTADDPIVFEGATNQFIASGNARLKNGPMLLLADRIELDRNASIATAKGNIILTMQNFRALADSLTLHLDSGDMTAVNYRMGIDPFVTEGSKAEQVDGIFQSKDVNLYVRDKRPWEPNLRLRELEIDSNESTFTGRGISFRVGDFTIGKLPWLKIKDRESIFDLRFSVGKEDRLGWYLEVGSLYSISSSMEMGGSVTGFTKRGALFSPEANYLHNYEGGYAKGRLLGGFINDGGDNRGVDIRGDLVGTSRGFADLNHLQRVHENFRLALQLEWQNDSETIRDFRRELFTERQWNDSHAEIGYEGENLTLSLFSRFHANEYETVVERRPELSLDLAPYEFLAPELYHSFSIALASLRKADPLISPEIEADRIDLAYGVRRPFRLTRWLSLTPLASYRLVDYDVDGADPTRHLGEIGADLRASLHGDFDLQNDTWEINGLRHEIAVVLSHRKVSELDSNDLGLIPQLDHEFQDPNLAPLDLFDRRQTDSIGESHLFRIGLENRVYTRGEDGLPHPLGHLLIYQDLLPDRKPGENAFDDFYADLLLSPADWLALGFQAKLDSATGQVERIALSTRLTDGDFGELDFALFDYHEFSNQYQVTGTHRLTERQTVYGGARYDAEGDRFTHLFLGMRRRLGDSWDLLYSVTRFRGALKEDDLEFDVSLRLYSF